MSLNSSQAQNTLGNDVPPLSADDKSPQLKDKDASTYVLPSFSNDQIIDTDNVLNVVAVGNNDPQDKYLQRMVLNIVDDVCLYHGKVDQIKKKYESETDQANMKLEMESIPLRAVPYILNPDDPKYRQSMRVNVENEKGILAGDYGWCFVCRGPAGFYCKDTRVPICGV